MLIPSWNSSFSFRIAHSTLWMADPDLVVGPAASLNTLTTAVTLQRLRILENYFSSLFYVCSRLDLCGTKTLIFWNRHRGWPLRGIPSPRLFHTKLRLSGSKMITIGPQRESLLSNSSEQRMFCWFHNNAFLLSSNPNLECSFNGILICDEEYSLWTLTLLSRRRSSLL